MKSTITSTISLVAGLAFVIVLMLFFSFLVGCDSNDRDAGANAGAPAAQIQAPAPVASTFATPTAAPSDTAAEAVQPAESRPAFVSYEDAEAAYREREYGEAVTLFSQYVEQHPDNPWGHYMLGLSAWKTERYDMAETAFLAALDRDPSHVKSLLNLSRVYLDTDRPEDALSRIEEASTIDPGFGVTYRLKGRALHELGRLADAEDAYREAIRIDNRDAWAMNNLGLVLIDEEFFELAIAPLARATEIRDDVAVFYNNLGMALERTLHFRDAEKAYAQAVELDGEYQKAGANLLRVQAVEEDPTKESLDLGRMAQDFEAEIISWSDESVPREAPVPSDENAVLESAVGEKTEAPAAVPEHDEDAAPAVGTTSAETQTRADSTAAVKN
jgi:Flp pilus assembly protein TadD